MMTTMTGADAEIKKALDDTRALVLAAGFGTRLRPITEDIPKPLLPVVARPLIEQALAILNAAEIKNVAINAYYHAESLVEAFAKGTRFGQKVTISHEKPNILGTGGAIKKLEDFLSASDPFIVCNGDTLSKPDLRQLIDEHKRSGAMATMMLRRDRRALRFGTVQVDGEGAVVDIAGRLKRRGENEGLFIGVHAISPEIFQHMPAEESFCINADVYLPLLTQSPGSVRAVFTDTPFFDLGTPDDYAAAQFVAMEQKPCPFPGTIFGMIEGPQGVFVSQRAHVDRSATLNGPCAVCDGAIIEKNVEIGPEIVIGAQARIKEGCRIARSIVMPRCVVEKPKRKLWRRIIGSDFVLPID